MFRTLRPLQLGFDVAVAVVFVLLGLAGVLAGNAPADVLVLVVLGTALGFRRVSPALALGVAWLGALLQLALGGQAPSYADLAILPVLYCTASYGGRLLRWLGLASAGLGAVIATVYLGVLPAFLEPAYRYFSSTPGYVLSILLILVSSSAVLGLSWTLGLLARTVRRARESRRAQTQAESVVAVEQERNRIARDMHDVVAHSLAVVIAQADGARYAAEKDPAAVEAALVTISATAREALGDVRVLLTQLRHSEGEAPQPILADLGRLVAQISDSGLEVDMTESGQPRTLPGGQQLALYRIAQEALTNALRHGDTSQAASLRLDWRDDRVDLAVTSRLGAAAHNPAGHGLAGMRERAILAGGALDAGPVAGDWVVHVSIPAAAA